VDHVFVGHQIPRLGRGDEQRLTLADAGQAQAELEDAQQDERDEHQRREIQGEAAGQGLSTHESSGGVGAARPSVAPERACVQHCAFGRCGRRPESLAPMIEFLRDLWDFLRTRKKVWMLPIILLMVVLGGLIIVSQQSVLGSFIYTLF
jgi:hypothetical protein